MEISAKVLLSLCSKRKDFERIDLLPEDTQGQSRPIKKIQRDTRLQDILFSIQPRTYFLAYLELREKLND